MKNLLLIVALLHMLAWPTYAQYSTTIRGDFKGLRDSLVPLMALMDGSPGIRHRTAKLGFSLRLPGSGLYKIEVQRAESPAWQAWMTTERGRVPDTTQVLFVQGVAFKPGRSERQAVSGVIERASPTSKVGVRLFLQAARRSRRRLVSLNAKLADEEVAVDARIRSMPELVVKGRTCGVQDDSTMIASLETSEEGAAEYLDASSVPASERKVRGAVSLAQVATDADYEYFVQYGSLTNSYIASVIQAAGSLYEPTFSVNFQVVYQNVFTSAAVSPYRETVPENSLDEFRNYTLSNNHLGVADIYHLFTGRDFDGSTIGVAFVGVICKFNNQYSFGVSQRFDPSADHVVFAHEVGHNFNASHVSDPAGIMYPSASLPAPARWSSTSVSEISDYLGGVGCLSLEERTPVPTPTLAPGETPVDTGGGGTGGGGVPGFSPTLPPTTDTTVSLSGSFRRGKGSFLVNINEYNPSCYVELLAGSVDAGVPEDVIYRRPQSSRTVRLGSTVGKSARGRFQLRARLSCPEVGAVYFSDSLSMRMRGSVRRRVSGGRWLALFQKRLAKRRGR
jgi:hypothetical protein